MSEYFSLDNVLCTLSRSHSELGPLDLFFQQTFPPMLPCLAIGGMRVGRGRPVDRDLVNHPISHGVCNDWSIGMNRQGDPWTWALSVESTLHLLGLLDWH